MESDINLLRTWLANADFDAIRAFARDKRRTMSLLTMLTYEDDRLLSWRAVDAFGRVSAIMAKSDAEYVRVHLRRLIWLLNDESGGIGWRAPEMIGEVIYHNPDLFSDFIPILVNLLDMEPEDARHFRAGWLWAIARLAAVRLSDARAALPWILPGLDDPDSQVRGMAIYCLRELGESLNKDKCQTLQADHGLVEIYSCPDLHTIHIAEFSRQGLG